MNAGFRTFRISSVSKEYLSLKKYEDSAKITSYQNEGGIFMKRTLGTKAGFGIGALLDKLHIHLYQDPTIIKSRLKNWFRKPWIQKDEKEESELKGQECSHAGFLKSGKRYREAMDPLRSAA